MIALLKIPLETLQTKLHFGQGVGAAEVGDLPAVFVLFYRNGEPVNPGVCRPDALTAMTAERARSMALALWEAADYVDRFVAQPKEGE